MADPAHLEILKKGIDHWNEWRKENPQIKPDLSRASLNGMYFRGANLSEVNLSKASLFGANLSGVNLSGTYFRGADLGETNLRRANLCRADLYGAELYCADLFGANLYEVNLCRAELSGVNLSWVNLNGADLRLAMLKGANLFGANLCGANFNELLLGKTIFADTDLSQVKGLTTCHHRGPSSVDQMTLIRSGKLPEVFLRGCGFPDQFIDNLPSLLGSLEPIQFYSSFISHSAKDDEFAHRLYADLQAKGIRCWFAPEDLKIGEEFRTRIDEVIRVHDKLLLILSESSVKSAWVEKEVETAFEKERERNETVLFPIRLDDAVMEIKNGWPADIRRTRHIGDFTHWKDHDSYQKAFDRLLRDLKNESNKDKPEP